MEFNNTEVYGFEGSFRGMRNPLESWNKSDSFFGLVNLDCPQDAFIDIIANWVSQEVDKKDHEVEWFSPEWEELWDKYDQWLWENDTLQCDNNIAVVAALGPNDLGLAQKLILAGPEHCKFMRQIYVSVDITAPIYWWKEFDTYKIGTTANSTSTMHKLTSEPITPDKFEWDVNFGEYQDAIMNICETLRQKYLKTKNKSYWRALVQMLPQSWLQTRTVTMSYANLRNIYFQRRDHKLIEWHEFCKWIRTLPWGGELIMLEAKENEIN